mgnify:CR=1 FL=1
MGQRLHLSFGNWGIGLWIVHGDAPGEADECFATLYYPCGPAGPVEAPHIRQIAEAWRAGGILDNLIRDCKYKVDCRYEAARLHGGVDSLVSLSLTRDEIEDVRFALARCAQLNRDLDTATVAVDTMNTGSTIADLKRGLREQAERFEGLARKVSR